MDPLSTLVEIELISLYRQRFLRYGPIFKIAIYLGMKLGHWPKSQNLHIYSFSTPGGRNWAYFCSKDSGFRDAGRFSKLPYLGMKPGIWKRCHKLHMDPPSTPKGSKLSLFWLYGQRFSRYGLIFRITIFGHENWKSIWKSARSCICNLLLPQRGRNWAFFPLRTAVSKI